MNDSDLASNYIRNINLLQKQGGSINSASNFKHITDTFENHYKNNCNCPAKKGRNHWYKLCDCSDKNGSGCFTGGNCATPAAK